MDEADEVSDDRQEHFCHTLQILPNSCSSAINSKVTQLFGSDQESAGVLLIIVHSVTHG